MHDYVVDAAGRGTHRTLAAAVEEAVRTEGERTIFVRPHQTPVLRLKTIDLGQGEE